MIADELKILLLGENHSLFMDRAVPEMKDRVISDLDAVCNLCHFAIGENITILITKNEETVEKSRCESHWNGFCEY